MSFQALNAFFLLWLALCPSRLPKTGFLCWAVGILLSFRFYRIQSSWATCPNLPHPWYFIVLFFIRSRLLCCSFTLGKLYTKYFLSLTITELGNISWPAALLHSSTNIAEIYSHVAICCCMLLTNETVRPYSSRSISEDAGIATFIFLHDCTHYW